MWQWVCMCTHLQQRALGHLTPACPTLIHVVGTRTSLPRVAALLLPVLPKQVAPAKIDEACSKAAAGHYQLACAAAWEGKHGCACETGINHPNQVCVEWRVQTQLCYLPGCCTVPAMQASRLLVRTAAKHSSHHLHRPSPLAVVL